MIIVDRRAQTIVWNQAAGPVVVSCGFCPVGWVIEEITVSLHADAITSVTARIAIAIGAAGEGDEAAFRAASSVWRGFGQALVFGKPGLMVRASTIALVWFKLRPYVRALSGPLTVFFARQVTGQDAEWLIRVVSGKPARRTGGSDSGNGGVESGSRGA